jgi:hypothetical protein
MLVDILQNCPKLHLRVEYLNEYFEVAYSKIKELLGKGRYRSKRQLTGALRRFA